MTTRTELKSITLGGFKSIKEVHTLPINRLTLLFGPNSAGKSSLKEAISCLEQIFQLATIEKKEDFAFEDTLRSRVYSFVKDFWHRPSDLSVDTTQDMVLGTRYIVNWYSLQGLAEFYGSLFPNYVKKSNDSFDIEVLCRFRLYEWETQKEYRWRSVRGYLSTPDEDIFITSQFEIMVNGHLLMDILDSEFIKINLNHPSFNISIDDEFMDFLIKSKRDIGYIENNVLIININDMFFINKNFSLSSDSFFHSNDLIDKETYEPANAPIKSIQGFFDQLSVILRSLLLAANLNFNNISDSRTIPTEEDLTVYIDNSDRDIGNILKIIRKNSVFPYRQVAYSIINKIFNGDDDSYFYNINDTLVNYLFIEKGYRVDYDYAVILDKKFIKDNLLNNFIDDEWSYETPIIIKMFLVDTNNRKLNFQNVGSGIGYVIPVIYAIFSGYNTFIQQPELHLHPALQANLADAFINGLHDTSYSLNSSTNSRISWIHGDESISRLHVASPIQFIIETHSEHFLLRLLKRIRQTSAGQPLTDELKLTPDNISIFYFNPHIDGDTSIHHIRVSEDGDFLDRWPHGFFPERDQELFDE